MEISMSMSMSRTSGCICWAEDCGREENECRQEFNGECHKIRPDHMIPTDHYCDQ